MCIRDALLYGNDTTLELDVTESDSQTKDTRQ